MRMRKPHGSIRLQHHCVSSWSNSRNLEFPLRIDGHFVVLLRPANRNPLADCRGSLSNHDAWISRLAIPIHGPVDSGATGSSRQPTQVLEVLSGLFLPLRTRTYAHINLAILKAPPVNEVLMPLGKRETTQVSPGRHNHTFFLNPDIALLNLKRNVESLG